MKGLRMLLLVVVVAGGLLLAGFGIAAAQDPAVVNASSIHVKLDNSHVRVLESTLKPGEKENMHSHPAYVIYVLAGGKTRNHTADGKTSEAELKAGDVIYRDPITHWAENIGTTTIHLILVEVKNPS